MLRFKIDCNTNPVRCDECVFDENDYCTSDCIEELREWLLEEYQPPKDDLEKIGYVKSIKSNETEYIRGNVWDNDYKRISIFHGESIVIYSSTHEITLEEFKAINDILKKEGYIVYDELR